MKNSYHNPFSENVFIAREGPWEIIDPLHLRVRCWVTVKVTRQIHGVIGLKEKSFDKPELSLVFKA